MGKSCPCHKTPVWSEYTGTKTNTYLEWNFPQDQVDSRNWNPSRFSVQHCAFSSCLFFCWKALTYLPLPGGLVCTSHTSLSVLPCKFSTQKDKACGDEWVVVAELCCRVSCVLHALWWVFVFTSFRIHNDSIFSAFPQRYPLHMKAESTRSGELISHWLPEDK